MAIFMMNSHAGLRELVWLACALAACGTAPSPATGDAAAPADTADAATAGADSAADVTAPDVPFEVADHPPAPQVLKGKGAVLAHPHARVVTFDGDPQRATAEAFVSAIGGSAYWSAATAEYGVGDLTVDAPIHLAIVPTPSVTESEVEVFLAEQLTRETALWGQPDPATIYVLVYPQGVTVTEPQTNGVSCKDFGGYHFLTAVGAVSVHYAMIPACPGFDGPGVDLAHTFQVAASHELLEAATDPDPYAAPAWTKLDTAHAGWATIAGGPELGDMCTFVEGDPFTWPTTGYTSERAWSDAAAAASRDPCQPAPAEPYFNAAPETPDTVTYAGLKVAGVHIAAGQDAVVPVHLFSDAPTAGPWVVYATDYATWYLQAAPQLQFDWDGATKSSGQNGDVLNLHITVVKADVKKAEPYFIFSRQGQTTHFWVGFVGN